MVAGFLGRVARRILESRSAGAVDVAAPAAANALPTGPAEAIAFHQSGVLSHQQGDSEAAVALIGRALDVDPGYVLARNNLGLVYLSLGRLDAAETELRRAIETDPRMDSAHASLGLVLRERGNLEAAKEALARAVNLNPRNVEARNNLGSLCRDTGALDAAESHYREALAMRPDSAILWQNLGSVQIARSDWNGAASSYRAAIEADSAAAGAWSSLGYALGQVGELVDAEAACRRALALRPDWPDALVNLSAVLKRQHDLEAAEEQCRRAIAIDPSHAPAHVSLGLIRQERDDARGAEACYRRAIELDPRLPSARYDLGAVQLLLGNYAEGFALVESRFDAFAQTYASGVRASLAADTGRRWNGEPLAGRRLLVWSEQGLGDSVMMLRFLPMLRPAGAAHVTFSCEPELRRIAQSIAGIDAVVDADRHAVLPEFDVHCPMMSLPFCLRIGCDSVPSANPYIVVPADATSQFAARLPHPEGIRVGVAWAGSPTLRDDAQRSVRPLDLAAWSRVSGVQWVSLQKGAAAAQIVQWEGPIVDVMEGCRDLLDTAALIANLDLVVSVDTAVVHLAGAMGKPVWLLNRAGSEWRWGLGADRSPWYPSLRIFRQRQSFDWRPVVDEIAGELNRFPSKDRT